MEILPPSLIQTQKLTEKRSKFIDKFLKKISLMLIFVCTFANASPLDSTGILNLKNEGTYLASCSNLGSLLFLIQGRLYAEIQQNAGTSPDSQWYLDKETRKIMTFIENANLLSRMWYEDYPKTIPPSQQRDYLEESAYANMRIREQIQKNDTHTILKTWDSCKKKVAAIMYKRSESSFPKIN